MQTMEKINRIEQVGQEAVTMKKAVSGSGVSWLFLQIILCVVLLLAIFAAKRFSPELYNTFEREYSSRAQTNLLAKENDLAIIHEE